MKRKALLILSGLVIGVVSTIFFLKVLPAREGMQRKVLPKAVLMQTGQLSVPREQIVEAWVAFTKNPSIARASFLGSCLHGGHVDEDFGGRILAALLRPEVRCPSRIRVNEPVAITCVLGKWFPLHGFEFSYEVNVSDERKTGASLPAHVRCDLGEYPQEGEYKETVVVRCSYRPYKNSMLDPDTFVGEPGDILYRCEVSVPVDFVVE